MTKVILSGCLGRMGSAITRLSKEDENVKIVCGLDKFADENTNVGYPVYKDIDALEKDADVIIDFSHPDNLEGLLSFATENNIAIVSATTGHTEEQRKLLKKASELVPVFFSANMSLGINLLIRLAKDAARVLEEDFDIEILEMHHNKKLDAPSGTALAIADGIKEVLKNEHEYVYERQSVRRERERKEIGISALRGGTVVGEHEVIFAGDDELVKLSHSAHSRDVFAKGALRAAKFLDGKSAGFYTMDDMFAEIL